MKNLLYIGNKLSGKGLNTTIIETLSAQLTREGYRVVAVSVFKNPVLRLLDMLLAVIRYRKSDYVLIDTYSTSGFWFAFCVSQLCRLLGKKYIPILHGGNLPNRLQNNPKLSKMVFSNAFCNVAPSNYLFEAFKKAGFSNLTLIPNPLEIEQYPFLKRTELQPKLLWVRAFDVIYNPKMAIDVLWMLQKKFPQAQICMVGPDRDGSMESCKKYASEKNVAVHFTGRLSKTEWIALAATYDIFINTTHFDNTPVSVMEAMALGLPVVTTNVGGIPFLLKDTEEAFLINDRDAVGMADAVQRLIQTPEMAQKMIENARKKAESWDWAVVKEQWRTLLS